TPAAKGSSRVPFDSPPAANHEIGITVDDQAAQEILSALSRPRFQLSDVKILEDRTAVRFAIQDSGRPEDVYERDFAAAFEEQSRPAVFDFRSIRQNRDRWQALARTVSSRRDEISRLAARRGASLLPGDRVISVKLRVFMLFGLAGLSDHLIVHRGEEQLMIIDLFRALGDTEGEPIDSQVARLARLIAGAAFREAWDVYRSQSTGWKGADPSLGHLEPLLKAVAETGPESLFGIDENFFPLSLWLKDPMRRAIDDLNRRAARLAEARENLDQRLAIISEMKKPEFARRVAGPDGAYLTDTVFQSAGIDGLRSALASGPRALFEAYDRAAQSDKELVPLSKAIREQLRSAAPATRPK
ncbi:MAG TPA: hypothetical protein VF376_01435, partial [Thermoanaerobaculia bacterium]